MKVLFSNPPWWSESTGRWPRKQKWRAGVRAGSRWPFTYPVRSAPDRLVKQDYVPYPFFMGYAASYVRQHTGAEVLLRDSIAIRESYQSYYRFLQDERPDLVFIESATPSWDHDAGVIRKINELLPDTKIALTGPITTTDAAKLMEQYPIIACIRGEYEKGAVKVVQGVEGTIEFDLLTGEEMNAAPYPYFDETLTECYWDISPKGQVFPHLQAWTSRGCPYKCIFCVWPATMTGNDPEGTNARTVRHYSPDYMEGYLREMIERYPFRSIYFDDDTFNLGNSHVLRMCEVMRRIGLPWSAMCRADTIKRETWAVMKESGCFGVKIGIESGSQYVVDKIVNKHLDLEECRAVIHELKRVGMTVHGTFTYGLPGETIENMQETKRFIQSLPFDSIQESGTAEIEGTPLHSLRQSGNLSKYEGARIDSNYRREVDGSVKYQELAKQLREG